MRQEQVRLAHFLSFLQRMLGLLAPWFAAPCLCGQAAPWFDAHTPVTATGSTTRAINNMLAKSTGTQKQVKQSTILMDVFFKY